MLCTPGACRAFYISVHRVMTKAEWAYRYLCQDNEITCEEWIVVLRLTTMWRFAIGRAAVLNKICAIADPVNGILLYQEYGLDPTLWLIPSVHNFVRRSGTLTEDEARRLGAINTLKVMTVHESSMYECREAKDRASHDCSSLIRKTFGIRGYDYFEGFIKAGRSQ